MTLIALDRLEDAKKKKDISSISLSNTDIDVDDTENLASTNTIDIDAILDRRDIELTSQEEPIKEPFSFKKTFNNFADGLTRGLVFGPQNIAGKSLVYLGDYIEKKGYAFSAFGPLTPLVLPARILLRKILNKDKPEKVVNLQEFVDKDFKTFAGTGTFAERLRNMGYYIYANSQAKERAMYPDKGFSFARVLGAGTISLSTALGLGIMTGGSGLVPAVAFGTKAKLDGYLEARQKGYGFETSNRISDILGITEGSLEKLGIDALFNFKGGFLSKFFKFGGTEFFQEFLQSVSSDVIKTITALKKFKGFESIKEGLWNALVEGAAGLILGGSASIPISRFNLNRSKNILEQQGVPKDQSAQLAKIMMSEVSDVVLSTAESMTDMTNEDVNTLQKSVDSGVKMSTTPNPIFKDTKLKPGIVEKKIEPGIPVKPKPKEILKLVAKGRLVKVITEMKNLDVQLQNLEEEKSQRIQEGKAFKSIENKIRKLQEVKEVFNLERLDILTVPEKQISKLDIGEKEITLEESEVANIKSRALQKLLTNLKTKSQIEAITKEEIRTVQQVHESLINASDLPSQTKNRMLLSMKKIQTQQQLLRALPELDQQIEELFQKFKKRELINKFKKQKQKLKKVEIRPEFKSKIDGILDQFDPVQISDKKFKDLDKLLEALENNSDSMIPQERINELKRLEKKSLKDMNFQEIQDIIDMVQHFIHLNDLKKGLLSERSKREFEELKTQSIKNINKKFDKLDDSIDGLDSSQREIEKKSGFNSLIGTPAYNAEINAEILDGADLTNKEGVIGKTLYTNIDKGVDRLLSFKYQFVDYFKDKLQGINISKWSYYFQAKTKNVETVSIKISGDRIIKMSKGEQISLYLHSLNKNSMRHLLKGGFSFRTTKTKIIKITDVDLNALTQLGVNEKTVAKTIYDYFNIIQKSALNKTSTSLWGYEVATEDDYVKIEVNELDLDRNKYIQISEKALLSGNKQFSSFSLEGMSMFKKRVKAENAILIDDAFYSVSRSMFDSAAFIGLVEPLRLAKKLVYDSDFISELRKNNLSQYEDFFKIYLRNIEGEFLNRDNLDTLLLEFANKIDVAILNSPWVWLKQTISYFGTITELNSKYLIGSFKPFVSDIDLSRMKKHPQLRERLEEGKVTKEAGEVSNIGIVKNLFITDDVNFSSIEGIKKGVKSFFGDLVMIRAFDRATVGSVWRAVGKKTIEQNPDLKGDDLDAKINEEAWRVIRRTQPTFHIKDRSGIAMKKDTGWRWLTKYSSQRNKNWVIIRRAVEKYNRSYKSLNDRAKYAGDIFTIFIINALALLGVAELKDFIKRKRDRKGLGFLGRATKIFISSWLGNIYIVGNITDAFLSKLSFGKRSGFDVTNPVSSTMTLFADTFVDLVNTIKNIITKEEYKSGRLVGEEKWKKSLKNTFKESLDLTSRLLGIGAYAPFKLIGEIIAKIYDIIDSGGKRKY